MRNPFSTFCLILFLSLFVVLPACVSSVSVNEGQEVKKIGVEEFKNLLAANKGKVVVLDFWATF